MSDDIATLVQADIEERVTRGEIEYGARLRTGDSIDNLRYAYEEALDLAIYLRKELAEREKQGLT